MNELPVWLRRLTPRHLETLLAIRDTGNLSRAAQRMSSTQPALSKWLRDLEDDLGSTLFERSTRRLAPTAAGDTVLRHAERVLGEAARTHEEMRALQQGRLGWVQLGMLPGLGPVLLPGALAWLREHGPGIDIRLRESTLDLMLPQLREHRIDLLVTRMDRIARNGGFACRSLFAESVCVMARAAHPLFARRRLSWEDAARAPWILPVAGSPMRDTLDNAFAQAGLPTPPAVIESASPLTNRALALSMDCLFLTSQHIGQAMQGQGELRPLPLVFSGVPADVSVMWSTARLSPPQAQVIDALAVAARSLQGEG